MQLCVIINLKQKIMTRTYSITGMQCTGCAGHVKDQLEEHPDVTLVDVSLKQNEGVINMNQLIPIAELQRFLDQDSKYSGRYSIRTRRMTHADYR